MSFLEKNWLGDIRNELLLAWPKYRDRDAPRFSGSQEDAWKFLKLGATENVQKGPVAQYIFGPEAPPPHLHKKNAGFGT